MAKGRPKSDELEFYDQPSTLMNKTIELAKAYGSPSDLCIATKIPFYWLRTFIAGEYKNPGVNRVQYLYEFLTGGKLV